VSRYSWPNITGSVMSELSLVLENQIPSAV